MRHTVRLLTVCVASSAAIGAGQAPAPASRDLVDRVVAVAANQVIMLSDARAFLELRLVDTRGASDPIPPILTTLIERQLVLAEIPANLIAEPSRLEVDRRMAVVAERLGGDEVLASLLPTVGFTRDDLSQVLREDLRVERYLARRFPGARQPTQEELDLWMQEHADAQSASPTPSIEAARDEARRQLTQALRQASIDAWVATLVDRGDAYRVP
jgi:hypothetical protein